MNEWVRALSISRHVGFSFRPFVPLKKIKFMAVCPINKVPDYSQIYISNILRVQEKLIQVGMCKCGQSFRPTHISWGFYLCPTPPTVSPVMQRHFLRALCLVRKLETTLDCVVLKDNVWYRLNGASNIIDLLFRSVYRKTEVESVSDAQWQ
jgi:hypothetical protein